MLEEQPQVGHGEHRAERADGAWHGSQSEVASGQKGMFLMGLSDRDGVLPPGRRREGSGETDGLGLERGLLWDPSRKSAPVHGAPGLVPNKV